jgi:hypothetical protein
MSLSRWFKPWKPGARRSRGEGPPGFKKRRRLRGARLQLETLEDRTLLAANSLVTALPVGLNDALAAQIGTPNEVDFFRVAVTESGLLTVQTQPPPGVSLASRLSLLGPDGQPLVQSDGASADPSGPLVSEHLEAGTYFLEVMGLGGGTGTYTLTTQFQPATSPFDPLLVGGYRPEQTVTADFNGDGYRDIATRNRLSDDVSILLGLGDGTFRPPIRIPVGHDPTGLGARDYNNDGHPDLRRP